MLARFVAAFAALAALSPAWGATLYSCPQNGGGGDRVDRGFYVQNFPAATLDTVALRYSGGPAGTYNVTLTARLGAYGGPILGSQTQDVVIAALSGATNATFSLGGTAVAAGSIVTFTQVVNSGPGQLFYDNGTGPCTDVFETNGTTPPLDTFRNNAVGVVITGTLAVVQSLVNPVPATGPVTLALLVATLGGLAAWSMRRSMHR